jgi:hypothetical protein|tara:strand:+ start:525 stop:866 length:342 start_codon:yes stop_codon:yes gene_type:complete
MAVKEESNLAKKAEEKSSEVKFSDEELKSLRDLQDGYQEKQAQFGQLGVQKILLNQQVEALEKTEEQFQKDYVSLQEKEQEIVRGLNEKYGPGTLDPQTGVFTPTPVETSETT